MAIPKERIDSFNGGVEYLGIDKDFLTLLDKLCPECGLEYLIAVQGRECKKCGNCQSRHDDLYLKRQEVDRMDQTKYRRLEKEKAMADNKGKKFY